MNGLVRLSDPSDTDAAPPAGLELDCITQSALYSRPAVSPTLFFFYCDLAIIWYTGSPTIGKLEVLYP